jgi:hypothetical protein
VTGVVVVVDRVVQEMDTWESQQLEDCTICLNTQ